MTTAVSRHNETLESRARQSLARSNAAPGLLPDHYADVVTAVETIEHLENSRAFVRELVRLTKLGGWIVITTTNQLSLLTLLVKHQFSAFQDVHYPAHLTALLEGDLRRIADEFGLRDTSIAFRRQGRLGLTPLPLSILSFTVLSTCPI